MKFDEFSTFFSMLRIEPSSIMLDKFFPNEGKLPNYFYSVDILFLVCINFSVIRIEETAQEENYKFHSRRYCKSNK